VTARTVLGAIASVLLFALSVIPQVVQTDECSSYAAQLGINPGPPTPASPHGITACDSNFSTTEISYAPFALVMLVLCMAGSMVLTRVAKIRSVVAVVGAGVLGVALGGAAGFAYSGLTVRDLVLDSDFHFVLVVTVFITAIMGALEIRRLPNTSLERTRER
jgi:hypothetical protein